MTNFLTRLELQGFKSFAGKTVLEFPSRVTAVVGPNGSGKSNIIDAIRWVLGEREAKQLRGETLDNLIFAGTPKKPAVGFAKVALCFNNQAKIFPGETAEAVLERRIDRSGDSSFLFNDNEIKLKDLLPLLAKARLGTRGLMIVGQGQSDIFVRSTPEERRLMIEEVLGLREFRLKKNQAERRLETSEINMEKVRAMLEELAPHVRILRRQKSRFLRRTEVEEELRVLEDAYFYVRQKALTEQLAQVESPLKALQTELAAVNRDIAAQESVLEKEKSTDADFEKARDIRAQIKIATQEESNLALELAKLEARLEMQKTVVPTDHSAAELKMLVQDLRKDLMVWRKTHDLSVIQHSIDEWLARFKKFFEGENITLDQNIVLQVEQLKVALRDKKAFIQKLQKEEEEIALSQQKFNQIFRERVENLNTAKNTARALEQRIQSQLLEKEKLQIGLKDLEREWLALGRALAELKMVNPPIGADALGPEKWGETERKLMHLRGELAAIGEIDANLIKEADESETRYNFLTQQLADLEKASADLKTLIKDLDERIHEDFKKAFHAISDEFNNYFRLMFGGGKAKLSLAVKKPPAIEEGVENNKELGDGNSKTAVANESAKEPDSEIGVEVEVNVPRKKITNLEMLSGGEKTLVSLAALFALIAISPPPFLVLDEIDAALDEENARRFAELIKEFASKTQFVIVTHNRSTMEAAEVLYGVTMGDDGVSKVLSLKLEE
jgi:chromosome segregation protein